MRHLKEFQIEARFLDAIEALRRDDFEAFEKRAGPLLVDDRIWLVVPHLVAKFLQEWKKAEKRNNRGA